MATLSIANFYKNQSIFITGATGFMGKVLVEKLLRSCSDIDKAFLLLRPSPGKTVTDRLEELIKNEVNLNKSFEIQNLDSLHLKGVRFFERRASGSVRKISSGSWRYLN